MSTADDQLLFGYIYTNVMFISSQSATMLRFEGLQMLETWINAVEQLETCSPTDDVPAYCASLRPKVVSISRLLTMIWSHPAKLVTHIVPVVYQRLVDYLAKSAVLRFAEEGNFLDSIWSDLIQEALSQPPHHRGRYQALTIILPKVPATLFVTSHTSIIVDLVAAVSSRDVSSAATKLLGTLLKYLRERESYDATRLRSLWDVAVSRSLCSSSKKLRITAADYLVTEMLSVDPLCGPHILACIRSLVDDDFSPTYKLFGMVTVVLQCRLLNLPGQEIIITPSGSVSGLQLSELRAGCVDEDVDLRLGSLFLIVASQKANVPLVPSELAVLMELLPYSLKDSEADHRHRVLRLVKTLVTRAREVLRATQRDGKKAEERLNLLQIEAKTEAPQQHEILGAAVREWRMQEKQSSDIYSWLGKVCIENSFPGASFDREIMTLDILSCVIENADRDSSQFGALLTPAVTRTVVNMFLSSWDKSRHLAADLILKFPRPLPGFDTPAHVQQLLVWATRLTGSARQRESDAGSQIIRVVFDIYCIDLKWDVCFESPTPVMSGHTRAIVFFGNMLSMLETRLDKINLLFSQIDQVNRDRGDDVDDSAGIPLCHGLLLGLRYCMSSVAKSVKSCVGAQLDAWCKLLKRSMLLAFRAMHLGVSVVAEAPSDVEFAPQLSSPTHLGPVNANSYMFLNTNSFMGAAALDDSPTDDGNNKELQRAVVGAWLLVKEASAMLSRLVEVSIKLADESTFEIFSVADIDAVGQCFVESLGRLKHMGAISEVHSSLQKCAEALLRFGFKNKDLCGLPLQWLTVLLDKLESKQQVFILRRSSGFAYSFLSLLRAEVSDSKPMLLSISMKSLLRNAVESVDVMTDDSDAKGDDMLEGSSEGWRRCVHSLNIIRLILLDSSMGPNLDPYIAPATELAVCGFKSSRWAIRNSSMMVFAAVVQRALANEKNDYSNLHASTANDFFHNFPSLFPFLLEELCAAMKYKSETLEAVNGVSESGEMGLDILYPLLLFVSKLRPETLPLDVAPSSNGSREFILDFGLFLGPIESCCSIANSHVRVIAAKALKSFVPLQRIPSYTSSILIRLHDSLGSHSNTRSSLNEVHGRLLLIQELMDSLNANINMLAANESVFADVKSSFDSLLIPGLEKLLEATHSTTFPYCPPIHLVLLRILIISCEFTACTQSKRLLWLHSTFCVENLLVNNIARAEVPYSPLLLRYCLDELIVLYFDPLLIEDQLVIAGKLAVPMHVILDKLLFPVNEVREGVLEGLRRLVNMSAPLDLPLLFSALFGCFAAENFPPLAEACLQLLALLSASVSFAELGPSFASFFTQLFPKLSNNLFADSNGVAFDDCGLHASDEVLLQSTDASAHVLSLLAWYVRSFPSLERIEGIVSIMEQAVDDSYPKALRLAVAGAWGDTMGLCASDEKKSSLVIRLYLMAVTLTQDDAEDVRCVISSHISPSLTNRDCASRLVPVSSYTLDEMSIVILKAVTAALNNEDSVIQLLLDYYVEHAHPGGLIKDESISRIFEEEVSNLFKEEMVVFKILAPVIIGVVHLAITRNKPVLEYVINTFVDTAVDTLEAYIGLSRENNWIGDVSYRKDMYTPLYGHVIVLQEIIHVLDIQGPDPALDAVYNIKLARYKELIAQVMTSEHSPPVMHPLIFKLFN
jgi:hypothetical protein